MFYAKSRDGADNAIYRVAVAMRMIVSHGDVVFPLCSNEKQDFEEERLIIKAAAGCGNDFEAGGWRQPI